MNSKKNTFSKTTKERMFVVGIGASAGGLEAIHELFDNMPDDTGYCFVIVQHLSPDYKSLMPELLAKHSQMNIYEAEDNMPLQKNCIYVIPSKYIMTLSGEKIRLTHKDRKGAPNTAIDSFLESLAKEKGKDAIAVILSGTGSDGTNGIEAVKANGGIVIVQDPISAKFDGMPNSAISTGFADLILSPDMIAGELLEYLNEHQTPLQKTFHDMSQKDEYVLREILEKVYKATTHDFSHYKRPTIHRRLAKRMALKNIKSLSEYMDFMNRHQDEARELSKEFLINVTKFFRDTEAFEELQSMVLPPLVAGKKSGESLKLWIIACSTGEEAYSIAILLHEYLTGLKLPEDIAIKIFATDIDDSALEVASKGIYPDTIANDISKERLEKYFIKEGNTYRITPIIRKMVVFANHNVLKDPPFSKVDLLSCRNMLIYMSTELQKNILRTIHFALNPGGYLFMGPSENIGTLKDGMKELSKKWKLYKNVSKPMMVTHEHYNPMVESKFNNPYSTAIKTKNALNNIPEIFKETIIDEYKYAGILVDKEFEVKQAIGNFKAYLNFPDGNFNLNLLKLVSQDLSIALSSGVRRAVKDSAKVVLKKIKLESREGKKMVNIIIKPYLDQSEYIQPFIFIVIHEEEYWDRTSRKEKTQVSHKDKTEMLLEVEQELKETKENLQAVIEELETANEELQSSNEEMISANEELQSTNEELQSLNEELHTVNTEHQMKIKELVELNEDLNNYFSGTEIGQLLIDKKLIIRRFSPAIKSQINLIETDIGRSIVDISNNFQSLDFINDLKNVMKSGNVIEKEVILRNKRTYLMRISPYIKLNNAVDGVVVTFIDISETKQLSSIIDSVFNSSVSGITAKKAIRNKNNEIIDFEYIAINNAAANMFGIKKEELIGKTMREMHSDTAEHFKKYVQVVEDNKSEHFEYFNEEQNKWYDIVALKMMDGLVITYTEITEKKKAAEALAIHYSELKQTTKKLSYTNAALEQSNYDLLQFASVVSHDLKEPLRKIMTFGSLLQANDSTRNEKEKTYLEKMLKSSARMKNLIDDLLSFSKLSNKNVQYQTVNVNDVIHAIIDDLEIQIKEQQAEIKSGPLPRIEALSGQVNQLFQNLISNSLKFVHNKKPKIDIDEVPVPKELIKQFKIAEPDDYVCISVKDNGIGFEEEYKEKIFGLFQRLPTTEKTPGTGIGLAICKKIVENHNGFISAKSEVGKGSTFYIILPLKQKVARDLVREN